MTRRVGLLGGTFDPIHVGHLDAAAAAQAALGLDRSLDPAVAPAAAPAPAGRVEPPPLRDGRAGGGGPPRWRASDLELARQAAVVHRGHARAAARRRLRPGRARSSSSAPTRSPRLRSWHAYPRVLDMAQFAVGLAPGPARRPPCGCGCRRSPMRMQDGTRPRDRARAIVLLDRPTADVSATAIRRRLADGQSIAGLVPPAVAQHIEQHGLYRGAGGEIGRGGSRGVARGRQVAWPRLRRPRRQGQEAAPAAGRRRGRASRPPTRQEGGGPRRARSSQGRRVHRLLRHLLGTERAPDPRHRRRRHGGARRARVKPAHVEGYDRSEWVLLDYFDFIVHVFPPETRTFYGLERLWGNAERIEVDALTAAS